MAANPENLKKLEFHRQGDLIAVATPDGATLYLTPAQSRAMQTGLGKLNRDVERLESAESEMSPFDVESYEDAQHASRDARTQQRGRRF